MCRASVAGGAEALPTPFLPRQVSLPGAVPGRAQGAKRARAGGLDGQVVGDKRPGTARAGKYMNWQRRQRASMRTACRPPVWRAHGLHVGHARSTAAAAAG